MLVAGGLNCEIISIMQLDFGLIIFHIFNFHLKLLQLQREAYSA